MSLQRDTMILRKIYFAMICTLFMSTVSYASNQSKFGKIARPVCRTLLRVAPPVISLTAATLAGGFGYAIGAPLGALGNPGIVLSLQ